MIKKTIDNALRKPKLKAAASEAVVSKEVMWAMSLDIAITFNSQPLGCITEALQFHGVPLYLRRLMADYLNATSCQHHVRPRSANTEYGRMARLIVNPR
ncbi:unnamed protein product [Euphydryas editha]|uniref:Uncharacterized protein n=1 Tax=Euphydryas editha TaxID=104508 RepID=A0AAU9VEY9_EUPED|nr:unnamed protein product [Euphydryas editha]